MSLLYPAALRGRLKQRLVAASIEWDEARASREAANEAVEKAIATVRRLNGLLALSDGELIATANELDHIR